MLSSWLLTWSTPRLFSSCLNLLLGYFWFSHHSPWRRAIERGKSFEGSLLFLFLTVKTLRKLSIGRVPNLWHKSETALFFSGTLVSMWWWLWKHTDQPIKKMEERVTVGVGCQGDVLRGSCKPFFFEHLSPSPAISPFTCHHPWASMPFLTPKSLSPSYTSSFLVFDCWACSSLSELSQQSEDRI